MKISIIGSGNMGAALGKCWASVGHQVLFSYARDREKLRNLALFNENTRSGTVSEALEFGEVILLAMAPVALAEVVSEPERFKDKILLTCVSRLRPDFTGNTLGLATADKQSMAETIAEQLPGARVVEAFNITFAQLLEEKTFNGQQPVVFYCSDHPEVKETVVRLITDCGYEAVNAGSLLTARSLETLATAWVQFAVVSGLFPRIGLRALKG